MACRSASVQRAEKKSKKALKAIMNLEKEIENLAKAEEQYFESKINDSQSAIDVDDFERVDGNFATKVNFSHEFNVDALTTVITNVLNAAVTSISNTDVVAVLTNPQNIKVYSDLLVSIAEAIKTKSKLGGNRLFSMNRLAPGFFSFTLTKSKTISDKETFGEESVTATTFFYALYFSKKHAAKVPFWTKIFSLIAIIRKLNEARVGLVDMLVGNYYTLAEFTKLSDQLKKEIENHESELAKIINEESVVGVVKKAMPSKISDLEVMDVMYNQNEAIKVLSKATDLFGCRGSLYSPVLREIKELLATINSEGVIDNE